MTAIKLFKNRTGVANSLFTAGLILLASLMLSTPSWGEDRGKGDDFKTICVQNPSNPHCEQELTRESRAECTTTSNEAIRASSKFTSTCAGAGVRSDTCYKTAASCTEYAEADSADDEDANSCPDLKDLSAKGKECPSLFRGQLKDFQERANKQEGELDKLQNQVTAAKEKALKATKEMNEHTNDMRSKQQKLQSKAKEIKQALDDDLENISRNQEDAKAKIEEDIAKIGREQDQIQSQIDQADLGMQDEINKIDTKCYDDARKVLERNYNDLMSRPAIKNTVSGGLKAAQEANKGLADGPKVALKQCLKGPERTKKVQLLINQRVKAQAALRKADIRAQEAAARLQDQLKQMEARVPSDKQRAYTKRMNELQDVQNELAMLSTEQMQNSQQDSMAVASANQDVQTKMQRANENQNLLNLNLNCVKTVRAKARGNLDPSSTKSGYQLLQESMSAFDEYDAALNTAMSSCGCENGTSTITAGMNARCKDLSSRKDANEERRKGADASDSHADDPPKPPGRSQ